MGQVRQMTIVSSNGNAASSGGATETAMTTPSGTNQFHGEVFWYNRNNALSANDWFNNQAGVALPFLNQNQGGASIGGPIKKDKLFFYANYEFVRAHQQAPAEATILTTAARQGNLHLSRWRGQLALGESSEPARTYQSRSRYGGDSGASSRAAIHQQHPGWRWAQHRRVSLQSASQRNTGQRHRPFRLRRNRHRISSSLFPTPGTAITPCVPTMKTITR